MSDGKIVLNVNLRPSLDLALLGVRRAAGFMALGLHAAKDPTIKSLNLDSNFKQLIFPEPLAPVDMANAKLIFGEWIVGSGLRELEQHFCIFADHLYHACLLVDASGGPMPSELQQRLKRVTDDTSLGGKLQRLAKDFGIVSNCQSHFSSISQARNTLTHALGIVRERDRTGPEGLRVTWKAKDVMVGDQRLNPNFEPFINTVEDAVLKISIVVRDRVFPVGTQVTFSPFDLTEICIMFGEEAHALTNAVEVKARSRGIAVNPPGTAEPLV